MMTSMEQAKSDLFHSALGRRCGVAIHMTTGAAFGGFFGLIARALRVAAVTEVTGIVYGLAVFAPST